MTTNADPRSQAEMIMRKKELEAALAEIKHEMMGRGRRPSHVYESLSARRATILGQIARIDGELAVHAALRREVGNAANAAKVMDKGVYRGRLEDFLGRFVSLRDRYRDCARDPRHTEAVRFMYQRCADDLDKALTTKDGP